MPKISRRFQFTTKNIKALPAHDRDSPSTDMEYTDSEVIGLRLFVSKTGRKSFHLRYWFNGRKRVIKIADFDCLPLPEVRSIARNYRGMIAKGLCPLEERLKRKSAPTFQGFCGRILHGLGQGTQEVMAGRRSDVETGLATVVRHCPIERDIQTQCSRQYHEDSAAVFRGHQ